MTTTTEAPASFADRIQHLESLIAQIEASTDPAVQSAAREMVQVLLDLHAVGIARLLDLVYDSGEDGRRVLEACAGDELVSSLLLLHGLHPEGLETRVEQALAKVRPYLNSHGGDVELLAIENGRVRLHLQGSCHGCPSSQATLQSTIEKAIYEAAPDVAGIDVEGVTSSNDLVQVALPSL